MLDELVDVRENTLIKIDYSLLDILLKDRTTKKNILWGTDMYNSRGSEFSSKSEILAYQITGRNGQVIKPRVKKSIADQEKRIRTKAEVFTPSWICNLQNNLYDAQWFGRDNVFNETIDKTWKTLKGKIVFPQNKLWIDYIKNLIIEISCGEAPYLVSRYDSTSGDIISPKDRIGLLDRKLRVVSENIESIEEWIYYAKISYKSTYGFEWQGDSLLIARENLLYTFVDFFYDKFSIVPEKDILEEIAEIISWNIFQMDGTKCVVPYSCKNDDNIKYTLFGEEITHNECAGCKKNEIYKHNGIYVKIMDWDKKKKVKFVSLLGKGVNL